MNGANQNDRYKPKVGDGDHLVDHEVVPFQVSLEEHHVLSSIPYVDELGDNVGLVPAILE